MADVRIFVVTAPRRRRRRGPTLTSTGWLVVGLAGFWVVFVSCLLSLRGQM